MPELARQDLMKTAKLEVSHSSQLPPLEKELLSAKGRPGGRGPPSSTDSVISEYQLRFEQIKKENEAVRRQKEEAEESYKRLMETNNLIQGKLENLEQIFLNNRREGSTEDEIVTSSLLAENTDLKKRLREMEQERRQVGYEKDVKVVANSNVVRVENEQLQKEIERLQGRERELLEELQKRKN